MSIRFAFVTDSHHYPDAPKDFGAPKMLTQSHQVLDAMTPALNAEKPDFVVHGGDLLCGGGSFDLPRPTYLRAIDEVATAVKAIEAPFYWIPGNHDCDAQQGSFADLAARLDMVEGLKVVQAAPRLRLALVNVFEHDPLANSGGIWTDNLDGRLRRAAIQAQADGQALLLVIHPWILPDYEDKYGIIDNAERLVDTISQLPAIAAVFTGHRHANRIRMFRDFLLVDTASLIGYPMGFRVIELSDDGYLSTRFVPLDLPDLIAASKARCSDDANRIWAGQIHDRDTQVFLPRLHASWTS
jgi:3',5'-cyclic AMP phosphodiesterase CpdA